MFDDALIAWDDDDDPKGNVEHIRQHGVEPEDFELILKDPKSGRGVSRSTGRPTAWGELPDGREIVIVYEVDDGNPVVITRVTAFER